MRARRENERRTLDAMRVEGARWKTDKTQTGDVRLRETETIRRDRVQCVRMHLVDGWRAVTAWDALANNIDPAHSGRTALCGPTTLPKTYAFKASSILHNNTD